MDCLLKDKVALITGASRGIGKSIALKFASQGACVILVSRQMAGLEQTAAEIRKAGGTALCLPADVTQDDQVQQMVDTALERFRHIDILVNNAGITRDNLIMKMSEEEFQDVIQTNLAGVFNGIKFVTRPMMKQRQGHIINMASVSGIIGNMGQANYSASKAGVIGLTKATAKELSSRGITVNAVAPGFIATEMTDKLSDAVKEEACKTIPLGAFGTVEDVAEAVVFLASDRAKYITGQVLCVDGGIAM